MSEYTMANFGALQTGQQDFLLVYNSLVNTLDDLDGKLKGSLAQWEGSAQTAYHTAKAQWDQAAQHMALVMNKLGGVIGTAHENYSGVEKTNAQMWT